MLITITWLLCGKWFERKNGNRETGNLGKACWSQRGRRLAKGQAKQNQGFVVMQLDVRGGERKQSEMIYKFLAASVNRWQCFPLIRGLPERSKV